MILQPDSHKRLKLVSLILGITHLTSYNWVLMNLLSLNKIGLAADIVILSEAKDKEPNFEDQGRSGSRSGGASRGECINNSEEITALIPLSKFGETVSVRPTFWFYVPYSTAQPLPGKFQLQDADRNPIFDVDFTLPTQPGYISLQIPETQQGLEVGKEYRWYFYLHCDRKKQDVPITLSGWVTRVNAAPEMQHELQVAQNQHYQVYANHRLWYDAIASLAELRLKNPQDPILTQEWTQLLQAKGVDLTLPNTPPVGSVTITP